ncbi:hypothetical protein KP509_02G047000 [Ceratopteris richardii]|uniref:C2 domain-containing protein n=1 Tax=Ceratopteris richardii TaxID=49495 RepID=A0A8T2VGW3_CERRI|nr:hypothetical protein KP509_02G047000 [Ceratopteris richardii]
MTSRTLVVEVCGAHNLMPKDGEGSSSAYVQVEFDGQRRRTRTKPKDLNPVWEEPLDFWVSHPEEMAMECVEATVYHDRGGRRPNFLGRVCVPGSNIVPRGQEALIFYALEKRGLFSHIKGELGLKVYFFDHDTQPPPPPPPEAEPPQPPPETTEAPPPPPPEEVPPSEFAPPPEGVPASEPPPPVPEPVPEAAPNPAPVPPVHTPTAAPMPHYPYYALPQRHAPPRPVAPATEIFPVRRTTPALGEPVTTYDLVEKMHYLFIRVVKARNLAAKDVLTASSDPYVLLVVNSMIARTRTIPQQLNPEWNEIFAFSGCESLRSSTLEVSVWDRDVGKPDDFLGAVLFDLQEVPKRVPPDSPLAPQWYRLEAVRGGGRVSGDVMLAVWVGTQADETFPEAWQSDSGGQLLHTRSKVYLSPKLWYLRVSVLEAQDLKSTEKGRFAELSLRVQLGFQMLRTRPSRSRATNNPFWNEDLILIACEPFEDHLTVYVLDRLGPTHDEDLGHARIPLQSIERRVDNRLVSSKWFNLVKVSSGGGAAAGETAYYRGRVHLRLCFDGGYHVMDETVQLSSDFRPTARQLWPPPIGVLELGILGAHALLPMKTKDGRGATDAYCVAKYGPKWVRTRTIIDTFAPRWNEQYTWDVYDACTVITVGVFDNCHVPVSPSGDPPSKTKDTRIGKVRIRLSALETGRIYTHSYPLIVLHSTGPKKMGELELAIRFSTVSMANLLHSYAQPLFPRMHHIHPFSLVLQESLRHTATELITNRLTRAEPPLRSEVVKYILDTQATRWSIRRSKANWYRILSMLSGLVAAAKWMDEVIRWQNAGTTILVHVIFMILVYYPELILPTLFLYMFLIGAWHYRFRPRSPPHMDVRLSYADVARYDELDEEYDTFPTSRPPEVVRQRYDRLRNIAYYVQIALGDIASQGERFQALLSWRDPRATSIFISFCLTCALVLYVTPIRIIILVLGLYYLRHPRFRDHKPPILYNFFRRLPALGDRVL